MPKTLTLIEVLLHYCTIGFDSMEGNSHDNVVSHSMPINEEQKNEYAIFHQSTVNVVSNESIQQTNLDDANQKQLIQRSGLQQSNIDIEALIDNGDINCGEYIENGQKIHYLAFNNNDMSNDEIHAVISELSYIGITELDLSECKSLTYLSCLKNLPNLRELNLSGCVGLSSLSSLPRLARLVAINLEGCERVESLASLNKLSSLEELSLSYCGGLRGNIDLSDLIMLRSIELNENDDDNRDIHEIKIHYACPLAQTNEGRMEPFVIMNKKLSYDKRQ